jgi:hypothetical protein
MKKKLEDCEMKKSWRTGDVWKKRRKLGKIQS